MMDVSSFALLACSHWPHTQLHQLYPDISTTSALLLLLLLLMLRGPLSKRYFLHSFLYRMHSEKSKSQIFFSSLKILRMTIVQEDIRRPSRTHRECHFLNLFSNNPAQLSTVEQSVLLRSEHFFFTSPQLHTILRYIYN